MNNKIEEIIRDEEAVWEQRKLGDIYGSIGNAFVGTATPYYAEQGHFYLESNNVKDGQINHNSEIFINDEFYEKQKDKWLHTGDMVMVQSGHVGHAAVIPEELDNTAAHALIMFRNPKEKIEPYFLNYEYQTDKAKKKIENITTGNTIKHILASDMQEFVVDVPKYEEQKVIAGYFCNIDHLITLHQRISLYFFKINTFVWEQRKLGDNIVEYTEKTTENNQYPVLTSSRKGIFFQTDYYDGNQIASADNTGYNIVPYGYFTYRHMSDDEIFHFNINDIAENGIVSTLYPVFTTDENLDSRYLQYQLNYGREFSRYAILQKQGGSRTYMYLNKLRNLYLTVPTAIEEQKKISEYFTNLDHLITLHQRKPYFWNKFIVIDWEQRKLNEIADKVSEKNKNNEFSEPFTNSAEQGIISQKDYFDREIVNNENLNGYYIVRNDDFIYNPRISVTAPVGPINRNRLGRNGVMSPLYTVFRTHDIDNLYLEFYFKTTKWHRFMKLNGDSGARFDRFTISSTQFMEMPIPYPTLEEQQKIGEYFDSLDNLITLHHHKLFIINGLKLFTVIQCKYYSLLNILIKNKNTKEAKLMPELERVIEEKLIDQLVYGDSQWTYREDLKTEEDLWRNFKYILEQNNKDRLNGESLSDAEFEQVKNQLQFSSFYKAGEWLVGENGKVMVHVQRDTEKLHLVVMNHEHIAGGSSVYEVINQYSALKDEDDYYTVSRNRRFDVTLMINGLPMIHIELKNRQHSYMDGFNQIKKYISEGKFTGIFSAVQMFVVSNGVDTKYFAAASDTDLNAKFMSGWVDEKNNPVSDYLDFAKSVLRIPEAHEMIARYTVLDRDAKRLIILRPYQIHAIESIREASKIGKSGFVWHTTGSGKTLTSYKATRNLLMDIPSLDKTIFLIDRKDLDTQTSSAFQAYANNDVIAVDKTDNVNDLKKKLKSGDRKVIVTTIQKMQILVTKRLQEDTPEYNKIKNLRIAFVVDECHRAVTPKTKRELERFFGRSLWFGFTGTPRFAENPYAQMGDLPRTTEELYGKCLHKYTIQNAIKDNAVLGFQVEHNGPKNMEDETDPSLYDNETHMLRVLDIILNKSYQKFGLQNGKGQTYEAILTTSSIQLAQKYYELLSKVKNGETDLEIDERMKQVLPDYPKFAITYSVTENEEGSHVNQEKMQKSLNDYNEMFGTKFDLSQIQSYNENLNKRLARKDKKYKSRNRQLDLVIVVDRLLTGFDAPCLSTIFIDRQPMGPHDLIQAFSRTNRIFDPNKAYGQIVTFQAPVLFKECVDNAVKLYSAGSTEVALLAEWDKVEPAFKRALSALKAVAETPDEETDMSLKELKVFAKAFQTFDRLFAQIKSFTQYDESMLEDYGITEEEYEDYVGHYQNAMTKIKLAEPDDTQTPPEAEETVDTDYELMAYSSTKIDYEYIINLIQNIVTPDEDAEAVTPEERQKQIDEVKQYIEEMRKDNPKVAAIMTTLVNEIEQDENKYKGQSIMNIVENMKHDCINQVVTDFCVTWYASKDDVMYAALHYRNGEIPNESVIKSTINYTRYKESQEKALPKFKYYSQCMAELRKILDEEIKPLITVS
ncbi:MAG: type I restriction endonuclease subunit R, EcoR124 family [Mediterraneibacter faecis]